MVTLQAVPLTIPENANLILGQSHFIKTVEDIFEAMVNAVPGAKFGVAFNEASKMSSTVLMKWLWPRMRFAFSGIVSGTACKVTITGQLTIRVCAPLFLPSLFVA